MIALLLAVATLLGQSPAETRARRADMILEAPSTRTIEKGDQSNIDDAKQVLVRTERGVDEAVAAARPGSAAAGRGFLEGDGRRHLHGQPSERGVQHGDCQRDGG